MVSIDGSLKDSLGIKNPYRYRGYRYDTETGLYYLQSRYYNPEWGRFINANGLVGTQGELLSFNMFAYCKNNPVHLIDPDGYNTRCDSEGGGGGIIIWGLAELAKWAWNGITTLWVNTASQINTIYHAAVNQTKAIQDKVDDGNSSGNNKSSKNPKNTNKGKLSSQQLNEYKNRVLEGKDVKFKTKEQALDFIKKKFPDFKQEVAYNRSKQGWHFDYGKVPGYEGEVEHINLYNKQLNFRVHITWD